MFCSRRLNLVTIKIRYMETNRVMKSYKGFDKNLRCRGFQYEIGKEYEEKDIEICSRGFHACENPLDVFSYYDMIDSRFCEVEQSGKIQKKDDNTKVCSSRIKIKAELKLADMINLGVEWLKEKTNPSKIINMTTDEKSGDYSQIGSSGDYSQIGSSGNCARIGSSGNGARIGSSGYDARIGSSGYGAQIGSSGDDAQIGSSGNCARIGSSGNGAKIDSMGENSVIMCAGNNSIVKAKIGSWITLAEWEYKEKKYIPTCVKTEYVDGERIKEDTWYKLVNGEFVEQ